MERGMKKEKEGWGRRDSKGGGGGRQKEETEITLAISARDHTPVSLQ